ncbi:MAG TPA: hypothetical protein PLB12_11210 [Candidatus Goldiibacteriota bacterium]|nr:hypothetical protein [Candidatus Goldiibacteriota bacterium]HPN63992.1 hypothetical protein [Candidatus Goldiibacteriota bacterium]HRQ44904.1 hypothetical protein [Candidatus Goldiibacteriota bacterium]
MKRGIIFCFLLVFMLSGCTMKYVLKDRISPDISSDKKKSERVLVVLDDEIVKYVESVKASGMVGSMHTYKISLGDAFSEGLINAVKSSYLNVDNTDDDEALPKEKYDKIMKFSIKGAKLKFVFVEQFFNLRANVDYDVEVEMEMINGNTLGVIDTQKFEGEGEFEGDADASTVEKHLGQTAKEGIKEVVNKVAGYLFKQQ